MLLFALALPVALMAIGGAIDYGYMLLQKNRLQETSDAAAVAAARELHLAQTDPGRLGSTIRAVVNANLGALASSVRISTKTSQDRSSLTVDLEQQVDGFLISKFKGISIAARSAVQVRGGTPLCVLGLSEDAPSTISLQADARLTGNGCAVYSNSAHMNGLNSKEGAIIQAGFICSSGGAAGSAGNYVPAPLTDCPKIDDPLLGRPSPNVGPCTATDLRIGVDPNRKISILNNWFELGKETVTEVFDFGRPRSEDEAEDEDEDEKHGFTAMNVTLRPGTYCGDTIIGGGANVIFEPGEYVFKDGQLYVTDYASVTGTNVGFYFDGDKSLFFFGPNTTVSLTAPKEGTMAGLLFYESRSAKPLRTFTILSDNARLLEGTIYLPRGYLFIDADKPIADKSAYTAIIAQRMALFAGPNLVLNTDYDKTEVPAPAGIAKNQQVVLTE